MIFIIACSSSELPPEPTPLENSKGITCNAVFDYTDLGWAPPVYIFNNNEQLISVEPNPLNFEFGQEQKDINIEVTQTDGLIYNQGYVMLADETFTLVTFEGEQVKNNNWLSEK